jgi:hypothetical protein
MFYAVFNQARPVPYFECAHAWSTLFFPNFFLSNSHGTLDNGNRSQHPRTDLGVNQRGQGSPAT